MTVDASAAAIFVLYAVLGALAGVAAAAFVRGLHLVEDAFDRISARCRPLTALIEQRGKQAMIGSDHGTELTSNAILAWCAETGTKTGRVFGTPMVDAKVEARIKAQLDRVRVS